MIRYHRILVIAPISASTLAQAQTPQILTIGIGTGRLDLAPSRIAFAAERKDQRGHIVFVRLNPNLRQPLSDLTAGQIKEMVILRVCGAEAEHGVLRERLAKAAIAITAIGEVTARHLAAVPGAKDCRNAPSS